ncbi:MAG: hypothetical protein HY616_13240 [Candidatus Rokubacteria bacterium]|nr:hypothetical protein [Candidatus Rokubacteria bacterium]
MRDPGLPHAAPPLAEVPADEIHSNAASLRDLERGGLVALAQADDLAAPGLEGRDVGWCPLAGGMIP